MSNASLLLGQTLAFAGDPFLAPIDEAALYERRGAVLVKDGRIADLGPAETLRATYPMADIIDYGDALITAGFIDPHVHYPQTAMIASWGKRLIDWLNSYTFPEEMRFGDPASAANPDRIVAMKHHSQKLLSEKQLRQKAHQLPQAAKKLMGVKPSALMPTWSTNTPPVGDPNQILKEGAKNLKQEKATEKVEAKDDTVLQASK